MKDVQPTAGMVSSPPTVDMPLSAPKLAWVRWSVGALALILLVTLAVPLLLSPQFKLDHPVALQSFEWAHRIIAGSLGVVLFAWIVNAQRAQHRARVRARLWEQSIESMKVGVALWDAGDRLIGCNDAYRALYSEVADQLVAGRTYREVMTAYFEVAPAGVVDGRPSTNSSATGSGAVVLAPKSARSCVITGAGGS